jgi:PD-(D/E)XK nuclease superfamily
MNRNAVPDKGVHRTAKHQYYWNGEGPWPGVTTITDIVHKPALDYWKREQVAIVAVEYADRLLADREAGRQDAAVAYLMKAENKSAMHRGTRLHAAIEGILRHENPVIAVEDQAAVEGARAWLNQQALEHGLRPLEVESYVLHPTLGYAGTVDLIAEIDGETWLLDWKTGKSVAGRDGQVYRDHRLQLAAYSHAEFIGRPADPERYPLPPITRHGIVHVTDGGTRLYDAGVTERDWNAFRAAFYLAISWEAAA